MSPNSIRRESAFQSVQSVKQAVSQLSTVLRRDPNVFPPKEIVEMLLICVHNLAETVEDLVQDRIRG